jgi:heat shock protein HtpX
MSVASGLPKPRVLVIPDPAPNALATGHDPERATIAVTTGLLEKLDRAQTQAVVAHEMAHVGNRDTRLGVTVAVMVGAIALLADLAWRIRWQPERGRSTSSSGGDGRDPLAFLVPLLLVITALAPIASRLVAFAISRQREYLADATAGAFTRNPEALASALEVIGADRRPTQSGTRGTAHLFFVRPAASLADERTGFLADLFATHPPIADRVARLRGMA